MSFYKGFVGRHANPGIVVGEQPPQSVGGVGHSFGVSQGAYGAESEFIVGTPCDHRHDIARQVIFQAKSCGGGVKGDVP